MDKAWFHFSVYINIRTVEYSVPKPMWIVLKSCAFVKYRCLVHSVLKTNCGTIILWKVNYCEKLPNLLTQFIALQEENKQTAGFSNVQQLPIPWKQQQLSCRPSSVTSLSGMAFGHHDSWTLHHLTSFSGNFLKEESAATTQEAWRISNITWNRNKNLFKSYKKHCERSEWLPLRLWVGGHFQHLL